MFAIIIMAVLNIMVAIAFAASAPIARPTVKPLDRNPAVVAAFRKTHPCPATGKTDGACDGWVVDHVWSLCLGGPDKVENMRWQSAIESQIKDVFERDMCAMKRTLEQSPK